MGPIRKNIMLGTAGHVDHGKTALVKVLTGCDTDTLAEEKQRGLTIDLGFAPCRMADERIVGVVDVPGHVDFIRNMVAGVQGIDVVIFVVAADDGVMPQTREHLDILTLLGVRGGIIALTKIDLVPGDLREMAADDVRGLVAGTFLEAAPICPVSNITGEGYPGLFDALNAAVAACPERATGGLFRAWIEDVHAIRGFGTVVTGIPLSGAVRAGDRLLVLPGARAARVRQLEVYGQESPEGRAGECVAINLSDVPAEDLGRGMVLCEGDAFAPVTMAEAELRLLSHAGRPLKDYAEVHLHVGTAQALARVAMLEDRGLVPGGSQMVQLRLGSPLGLAAGDRFVIRAELGGIRGHLVTVGGGRILSTSNIRLRRNRPWTIAGLAERRDALDNPAAWCAVNLKQADGPVTADELARLAQRRPAEVEAVLDELVKSGAVKTLPGGRLVHSQTLAAVSRGIVEELGRFHAENPSRLGLSDAELAARLAVAPAPAPVPAGPPRAGVKIGDCPYLNINRDSHLFSALVGAALEELIAGRAVERQGAVVLLAGRGGVRLSEADRGLGEKLEAALRKAHLAPPRLAELAAALGADAERLRRLARLLTDQGALIRLDEDLLMHKDAVEAARKVAVDLFAQSGSFETVQYRDALGVSRKYAVPLLDYFDTVRLTVRSGSRRTPGAEARRLLAGGP